MPLKHVITQPTTKKRLEVCLRKERLNKIYTFTYTRKIYAIFLVRNKLRCKTDEQDATEKHTIGRYCQIKYRAAQTRTERECAGISSILKLT